MPKYRTRDIRNLTFVGHTGSGKTSLIEAMLVRTHKKFSRELVIHVDWR